VAEAVPLVQANPRYAAPVYALGLRVEADRAELARARHPTQPAPDDATAAALLQRLPPGAPPPRPPRPPRRGGRRRRGGRGWAGPPGPPTPASATPRRSWPPAPATAPRRCWAAPPPSP